MQILVDYVQGTNGAYLEYIGNTFVIPTVEFHSPFDELHRSHNKKTAVDSRFVCGHFYHYGGHPALHTHIVWIDVDAGDGERLRKMMQAKFGNGDTIVPYGGWTTKPDYVNNPNVFKFRWNRLFGMNTFLQELERMAKFLGVDFAPTGQLVEIHAEFLRRHHFLLAVN